MDNLSHTFQAIAKQEENPETSQPDQYFTCYSFFFPLPLRLLNVVGNQS